jgi:hypothetical protein
MSSKAERQQVSRQLVTAISTAPRIEWLQSVLLFLDMLEEVDPGFKMMGIKQETYYALGIKLGLEDKRILP